MEWFFKVQVNNNLKMDFVNLTVYKPVKRFQMKSNGCRDVQHTGLQSTQTRRNTGKQCALDWHISPSIPTSVAAS